MEGSILLPLFFITLWDLKVSSNLTKVKGEVMEKNELFTIKPSLRQYYGRTVTKDMSFDEKTDDGTIHQTLKDLVLTTEINKETEYAGIKSTEKSILTQELKEGTILIWDESAGYILPDREVYKLENLKEEIKQIQEIYKDVNK